MREETSIMTRSYKMSNLLVPALLVVAVLAVGYQTTLAEQSGNLMMERQGRSVSGSSNGANSIDVNSQKAKIELEKRELQQALSPKSIIKHLVKLLFGSKDEVNATSRNVLTILAKVLDVLKNTFGQKARNGSARTLRDSAEDAASAGVSILQGYVKSVLTEDENCVRRHLCQANQDAVRDGHDSGFIIATLGSYATNYLLDNNQKPTEYKGLHVASKDGRNGANCTQLYSCSDSSRTQL